jgi:hypothetical protein
MNVIKHAEETNNCTVVWKFCTTKHNVRWVTQTNEPLKKGENATQTAFCRLRQGYFSALMKMFWTDNMSEGTGVTTSL